MIKNQYHLATFNKPLTESSKLPAHVIERPADLEEQQRIDGARQYGTVQNLVYKTNYEQAS
jgi:hypothetical protein